MRRLWGFLFNGQDLKGLPVTEQIYWGKTLWICGILAVLLYLTACTTAPTVVEVTRLASDDTAVLAQSSVEVTVAVPVEVTRIVTQIVTVQETVDPGSNPPGTAERPYQLLFAPTADSQVIRARAQVLADWLAVQTGQQFQVGIVDNEQRVIDLMCAAPADTVGFLTAVGVGLANQQCGAQVINTAVQANELSWQAGMIVVRQDSGITELADLDGKRWAIPSESSVPNNWYFQALLAAEGIEPAEIVSVPGDNTAMLAVLNGDVDFATGSYVPPLLPFLEREWVFGEDDPELWRWLGIEPSRSGIGFVIVLGRPENGGYRIRDARSGVFDIAPEIFTETRILTLSAPIPADSVAVGGAVPFGLAQQLGPLLSEFAALELCGDSLCAPDFYGWLGLETAVPASYEPVHFVINTLGWTDEALLITE